MNAPRPFLPLLSAVLLSAALLGAAPARAHDFVVDQSCAAEMEMLYSIRLMAPLRQTFVPSLPVMDAAELFVVFLSNGSATLQVRVRRDSLEGPVLGTSAAVDVNSDAGGPVHFDFPAPVTIEPGKLHVLEVVHTGGTGNPMLAAGDDFPYFEGEAHVYGTVGTFMDFWFRTGADQSLPARSTTWGAIKAAYR